MVNMGKLLPFIIFILIGINLVSAIPEMGPIPEERVGIEAVLLAPDNEDNSDLAGTFITLNLTGTKYGHELLWKANTTSKFDNFGGPAILDGRVFVSSKAGWPSPGPGWRNIWGLNQTTGTKIWNQTVGNSDSTPTVVDNKVYYLTYNYYSTAYIFNATNGNQICNFTMEGTGAYDGSANSPLVYNGRFFFGELYGADSKVWAINATDCSEIWNSTTVCTGSSWCMPGTSPTGYNNVVYMATYGDQKLYALNETDGTEIWNTPLGGSVWDSEPTIAKDLDLVYIGTTNGKLHAIYIPNGTIKWSKTDFPGALYRGVGYHDGRVFIASSNSARYTIYALNATTGGEIWTYNVTPGSSNSTYGSVALAGGFLFVPLTDKNTIYMFNETTGEFIWSYTIGARCYSAPAIANGMLLFSADDWYEYAFDIGTGSGNWTTLRHDNERTGYCPDCLTEWQYVKANCTTSINTTCTVANYYDHNVTNITLNLDDYNVNWYNSSGALLKSNSDNYTIITPLESSSSITLILEFPVDANTPQFSNYNGTANNTAYSPGASYEFNATILNTNGTAGIEFNGVNHTASNSSEVFTVTISDLPAGTYNYYWWAYGNGTDHNFNASAIRSFIIVQATTSLALTGTSPVTYGTAGDYQGTGCPVQLVCNLYRDGVEVSNPDNSVLAAGIYDYEYNTTGNTNYTSDSKTATLTVNPAVPQGSLTNSESWTVDYGTEVTIGLSESNPGDGDVTYVVYRNGESRGAGETVALGAGIYNYVLNTTGGSNYTANASMDSETLTVNQIVPSVNLTLNNSESNITITQGDSIDLNCSVLTGDASANLLLYRHGSLINNGTSPIGNTTTFDTVRVENITCVHHESQNYTTSSATWWVNVTADEVAPVVTIVYPAAANYSVAIGELNYTGEEANPDMGWFSNDSGMNNYSVQIAGLNFSGLSSAEGANTWTVYCNDTAGNINSTTRYFTIDTTPPGITVIQPFNATYSNNTIEFNITANEALSSQTGLTRLHSGSMIP